MAGHSWNGKAGPRHPEIVTETLGLRRAEGTKTLSSPGIQRSMDEVKSATDLSEDHASRCRRVCVRINYFALDTSDILFAAKDMARRMSQPHTMAWEMAKICGRYLLGKPRMVQRFVTQLPVDTVTLEVGSDHAGCWRT